MHDSFARRAARLSRPAILAAMAVLVLACFKARDCAADQTVLAYEQRLTELRLAARFTDAEKVGYEMLNYVLGAYGEGSLMHAAVLSDFSGVYADASCFVDAESKATEAIAIMRRLGETDHPLLGETYNNLAACYYYQHRYEDAIRTHAQALAIRRAKNSPFVGMSLENLATSYDALGQFAEAEPLYRQALAEHVQRHGNQSREVAINLANQGLMYKRQGRLKEAEAYLKRMLDLAHTIGNPEKTAVAQENMGDICVSQGRFDEAEKYYRQARAGYAAIVGEDSPLVIGLLGLGHLYTAQKRFDEAEAFYATALAAREKSNGPRSWIVAEALIKIGQLRMAQNRPADAKPSFDRAIDIYRETGGTWYELGAAHFDRGRCGWRAGDREGAARDFEAAMKLADTGRANFTGAEHQKAESFAELLEWYSLPGQLYAEAGMLDEALAAFERGRARLLLEEIALARVDLTRGLPAAQAAGLRSALTKAQTDLGRLESELEGLPYRSELDEAKRAQMKASLVSQIAAARARVVEAYTAIRAASPGLRQVAAQDFSPVSLPELDDFARQDEALVLYYAVSRETARVIAIGGDEPPRTTELKLDAEQAALLGIEAGTLNVERLARALANEAGDGVSQLISRPDSGDQATAKLQALWQAIVPAAERERLTTEKVKRLIVIPDGPLCSLPFETLVVESGPEIRYLLDAGPPVSYAPSATLLSRLASRPEAAIATNLEPVLTVGDPAYTPGPASRAPAAPTLAMRSRFGGFGVRLDRLPYSAWETSWVAEVFEKQGIATATLKGEQATEPAVRAAVVGRRVVHLACHGLADQSYGNFFGALALTPASSAAGGTTNDGFLSLTEMYSLDLSACELAILSACQTNYGPQQAGEGVWALTRGCVVAGARRVIASNWLVDDEAAASQISYMCSLLAKQQATNQPIDHAQALRDAKLLIRNQDKWSQPYYWATFELVGPN